MPNKQSESSRNLPKDNSSLLKWFAPLIFILIALFWIAWFLVVPWLDTKFKNTNTSGPLGDSFGALNTLFSGLAFGGLIVAILLQRKELNETNRQTAILAKENERQRKEFEKQNAAIALQRFESTFFRMIQSLQDIVENLYVSVPGMERKGRGAFEAIAYGHDNGKFKCSRTNLDPLPTEEDRKDASEQFHKNAYSHCHNEVGHYFRLLYHIVKFIDRSNALSDIDSKRIYIRILRAHLSTYELKCILYNGLADGLGYPQFYILIDKYELLKNLPTHRLKGHDHKFYPSMIRALKERKSEKAIENFPAFYSDLLSKRYLDTHDFE